MKTNVMSLEYINIQNKESSTCEAFIPVEEER